MLWHSTLFSLQDIWHSTNLARDIISIFVDKNTLSKSKSIVLKCGEKKKSTELIHDVERVWQELLYANVPPFYRDAPQNE